MKIRILFIALFVTSLSYAQDDLLKELEDGLDTSTKVTSVFKGLKIINMESTKLAADKDFYFLISHRFGSLKNGISDLFGLDNANIRFSFVYGVTDWLNVGVSRSSASKIYDGHLKFRLAQQDTEGFPFTVVGFNSIEYNSGLSEVNFPLIEETNRYAYTSQLLISRKVNDDLSLQLAPVLLHENFVENDLQDNTQYLLGLGGALQIEQTCYLKFRIPCPYESGGRKQV